VFQRNDDYFGPKPAMARMIFQNVAESAAQRLLLEKGDADVAWDLNSTDLDQIRQSKTAHVGSVLAQTFDQLTFNHGRKPFDDPRVVNAFRYLIDYDALASTVMGKTVEVRQTLAPLGAIGALDKAAGAPYKLDLAKAKDLITQAGYPNGFTASLWTATAPGFLEIAQHIQQNASKIGITLNVERKSDGDLFPRYRSRDYDIVLVGWGSFYPDTDSMAARFALNPDNRPEAKLTSFPTWRANWSDPWFNEMTLKARAEPDPAKRSAIYQELQQRWMTEAPFVFLFQVYRSLGVSNSVKRLDQMSFADYFGTAEK
jgi:peptide/nickel transport system substrate-binding protein